MEEKNTEKLSFYDLKTKKKFVPKSFKVVKKNNRRFGVATTPSGSESWRALKNK